MTTYNHLFSLGFTVISRHSDEEGDEVTVPELRAGLFNRIASLEESGEWLEAVGCAEDTFVTDD